ncbi:MAG TPA: glycosyltransferase family 2 protein [Thermoplasmata archaeon]|nr:glycosyltransferase family 2 protein [Thermoplasmata archaeon]
MRFSVVAPCHNEALNIGEFVERTMRALPAMPGETEVIVIDDRSDDGSWEILEGLARRFPRVLVVQRLPERGRQMKAMSRGIEIAAGEWIIFSDADLQVSPEDFPRVAERLVEGVDVCATWSAAHHQRYHVGRYVYSRLNRPANVLYSHLLLPVPVRSSAVTCLGVRARFLKGVRFRDIDRRYVIPIAARRGACRIVEIEMTKQRRVNGRSHYSLLYKTFFGAFEILAARRRIRAGEYDEPPVHVA